MGYCFDLKLKIFIFTTASAFLQMLRWLYFAGSVRKVGSLSSLTSVNRPLSTGVEGNLRVPGR